MTPHGATPPHPLLRPTLNLLALLPAIGLGWRLWHDQLGADPAATLQGETGLWALNFLVLTLCISPLRSLSGWHWLMRWRRTLGRLCFFYASLHALAFVLLEHDGALTSVARDVLDRPFIAVGMTAFLLLVPLALTSSQSAMRWLGGRRWQELHRSIYLIAILACVHYLWLVKITALVQPVLYTLLILGLLGWRAGERLRRARQASGGQAPKPRPREQVIHFTPRRPR